jgi:phage gp16-like protein
VTPATDRRRAELAKIHILAKQLGLDDESYRNVLWTVARVHSSRDLEEHGRGRVIEHMQSRLPLEEQPRRRRPTPAAHKAALVGKIHALLVNATPVRTSEYSDALARRMFQVERFEWCTARQLHSIVAALNYDAKRHAPQNAVREPA